LLYDEREQLGDLGRSACPKLNGLGLCTVHDERPLICRLWGVVENMPCPHGCTPTRMLTVAEGAAIVTRAEQLAGPWCDTDKPGNSHER
jgi:Fe-S-cluster containining protein